MKQPVSLNNFSDVKIDYSSRPAFCFSWVESGRGKQDMHYHASLEVGLCLSGYGVFFINDRICPFGSGDVTVIYPEDMHIAYSPKAHPSEWLFFNIDMFKLPEGFPSEPASGVYSEKDINLTVNLIFDTLRTNRNSMFEEFDLLIKILGIKLARFGSEAAETEKSGKLPLVMPAVSRITSGFQEKITAEELAEECYMSVSHFRKTFKEAAGVSPLQYLLNVRLNAAASMLKAGASSIKDVYLQCGFGTFSSFNRKFKEFYGCTPTEFKKR